nr:bacillithiol biosynthesis cysteine-adding enzyme BshC [Paenibacillus bovis]
MEFESMVIPAMNDFASLYIEQKEPVRGFFHYDITENTVFEKRYQDVMNRKYNRADLAECIKAYMLKFPQSEQTKNSLKKLQLHNSSVVIGGQQAGLLTGPLYTIHKVISIIKLAEHQEKKLGTPVIPVFWIAGEDHDVLEVNHVYVEAGQSMKKMSYQEVNVNEKRMTSDISFNKDEMKKWIDSIFMHFGERKYTKELLSFIDEVLQSSHTITDLFSYIIMELFKDYGLLIMDAADPNIRKLEQSYFEQLINENTQITNAVLQQQDIITGHGFKKAIEIDADCANIFYYKNNERLLLNYDPLEDMFVEKKGNFQIERRLLLEELNSSPEKFSNNVVTRPVMQEFVFPSLAFIAGPGEIAYWGELKQVFEHLGIQMPPIIPRLNMTFVEAVVERDVNELELDLNNVLKNGVNSSLQVFLDSERDQELISKLDEIASYLKAEYNDIFSRLEESDRGLLPLAKKNLNFHLLQLEFLERKSNFNMEQKFQATLDKYKKVERHLYPNGIPQERIWNIFYYLNEYGLSFIDQLMMENFEFDGKHKVIKI